MGAHLIYAPISIGEKQFFLQIILFALFSVTLFMVAGEIHCHSDAVLMADQWQKTDKFIFVFIIYEYREENLNCRRILDSST